MATDIHRNLAINTQTITVEDMTAPSISCDDIFFDILPNQVNQNNPVVFVATSTDNYDDDPTQCMTRYKCSTVNR